MVDSPFNSEWDWGRLYDSMIEGAIRRDDLLVLKALPDEHAAYQEVTRALLEEGIAGRRLEGESGCGDVHMRVKALIVWDGRSRGPEDLTDHFAAVARLRNFQVLEVLTLECPKQEGK